MPKLYKHHRDARNAKEIILSITQQKWLMKSTGIKRESFCTADHNYSINQLLDWCDRSDQFKHFIESIICN